MLVHLRCIIWPVSLFPTGGNLLLAHRAFGGGAHVSPGVAVGGDSQGRGSSSYSTMLDPATLLLRSELHVPREKQCWEGGGTTAACREGGVGRCWGQAAHTCSAWLSMSLGFSAICCQSTSVGRGSRYAVGPGGAQAVVAGAGASQRGPPQALSYCAPPRWCVATSSPSKATVPVHTDLEPTPQPHLANFPLLFPWGRFWHIGPVVLLVKHQNQPTLQI